MISGLSCTNTIVQESKLLLFRTLQLVLLASMYSISEPALARSIVLHWKISVCVLADNISAGLSCLIGCSGVDIVELALLGVTCRLMASSSPLMAGHVTSRSCRHNICSSAYRKSSDGEPLIIGMSIVLASPPRLAFNVDGVGGVFSSMG